MAKIVFIGAGSTVFARALLHDLFTFPELRSSDIHLVDIDPERLRVSEITAKRLAEQAGAGAQIRTHTDRRDALADADYVINMIQVGNESAIMRDFDIPTKFGVRQTIGDTLGIGGIMRGLRTIPVTLDIVRDMEEFCPDALLINYSNPMAMLVWAIDEASSIKTVGLCHSVFNTARELAYVLQLPVEEIDYLCAGVNHMAFYLRFEHKGRDLYPRLKDLAEADEFPSFERVRANILRQFGYFVTESSEHFSEYTPWFIKQNREDLIDHYRIPLDALPIGYRSKSVDWAELRDALFSENPDAIDAAFSEGSSKLSGMQARRVDVLANDNPEEAERLRSTFLRAREQRAVSHSGEYGTLIIHSMETGQPRVIYGNVRNNGIISNLPADCVVEVPCLVDTNGVQATDIGELPPQLAALMQTNVNVQRLTVEAALTGRRDHVYQAAMLNRTRRLC